MNKEFVPVFGFSAYSGTGKTTLIEKLVRKLSAEGCRVAVVKHDVHGFEIDREGKDSWRFTQAGASVSLVSTAQKTAVIEQKTLSFPEILSRIHDADLILVEGYKKENIPRIGLSRTATGQHFPDNIENYIAVVTDWEIPDCPVPRFEFDNIEGIASFMKNQQKDFTHFNEEGRAVMVDVGEKPATRRQATAEGRVVVNAETFRLIQTGGMKKGDVLTVAQIAGVMGAKKTPDLIPLCHPIPVDGIDLALSLSESEYAVEIQATVTCFGHTGVEMEALTAVSTAALTIYDMCKAVQKDMTITGIRLLSKTGGIHGDYLRKEDE